MNDMKMRQEQLRRHAVAQQLRLLFIGNSATYVHEIPQTLCRLATEAGYRMESVSLVKGGYELAQHANAESAHGQTVLAEIGKGYDIVFLQDNGNCVTSDAKSEAAREACRTLHRAISATAAATYIYVRPPYGYDTAGRTPLEQCVAFDDLFGEIAEMTDAVNVYVNRAFAYAMTHPDFDLWGPDHAHTGEHGAYLAVCTFFATLFGISSTVLSSNGLAPADAHALQSVADLIALEGIIPWQM